MATIIQVNDVHTCDKPPKWRTESYNDDIFNKLEQIIPLVKTLHYAEETIAVVFTGDLFHFPQPHKVSHLLVNRWLNYLNDLVSIGGRDRCPVFIIPGNHDMLSADTMVRQPIMSLGSVPGVVVATTPGAFELKDKTNIFCIPWRYDATVESVRQAVGYSRPDVLFLHGAVAREENPFYPVLLSSQLDGIAKVVGFGHLHVPEDPYTVSGATTFVNPGALSRGSLTQNDLQRTPQVAIIRTGWDYVDYYPLKCKPAKDIFRIEEASAEKTEMDAISTFVDTLGQTRIDSVSPDSILNEALRLAEYDEHTAPVLRDILRSVE